MGIPVLDNDGNIYVPCGKNLYSLSPSGSLRWQAGGLEVFINPAVALGKDGSVYVAANPNLLAFDYAGRLKWSYPLGSSDCVPVVDSEGSIYVGRTRAFHVTPDDTVNFVALHPDGTLKYKLALRMADGTTSDISSRPAITTDGEIVVGCDYPQGRRVFCIK
jgi:outer membrane protein assembly factor BamB